MKRTKVYAFAALLMATAFLGGARLVAHHSAAMFDDQKMTEINGTVREFQWANPHIWIQVDTKNQGGAKEEWSVEGGSPNSLSRQGWKKTTFAPGTAVTLRIRPMRDGTHAGSFIAAKFADGTTLGRWE